MPLSEQSINIWFFYRMIDRNSGIATTVGTQALAIGQMDIKTQTVLSKTVK